MQIEELKSMFVKAKALNMPTARHHMALALGHWY